ncbi:S41 family peptidase [Roseomonas alkaliterrae]|uniref:Carboxyl-terminal processing protease n=1 Tax=Neoroseomonas alkaliterrae TaxID=1452450 RepID=A0A840XQM0_9PROT|nr:S41 family peptidase [Neoroseomonas alkaliterrae]MBB5690865.1 carboxyl-terminal processing protease [Neoroseomonas alkaliterrae]MBR0678642.1 S41 family peptidase [Neoroseomonas alkaliterrae]
MRRRSGTIAAVGAAFAAGVVVGPLVAAWAQEGSRAETYRLLNLFGDVFERIRAEYVEPVNDRDAIENAIQGMLSGLDPHSSYLNPRMYRDMQVQTRGEFGGLGIEVTQEGGFIKVISPIDDTPAARAGVRPGDLITHLNGNSVQGLTLQEAVEQMRGERGTSIRLTIRREGAERPIELSITRDVIRPQIVRFRLEGGDIGYIRISSFNEQTEAALRRAMQQIRQQAGNNLRGLVLDLRNNPGGLLDQAVQIADDFLDQGEIVSTRARRQEDGQRWNARPGDIAQGLPIVVLINSGSASASEIVAGALQDHRRAIVMGVKSFGKGSVQTVMPIPGNGAIRLTTARYYTPSGRSIQATGIEPDIEVLATREDTSAAAIARREREADLRRALRNDNGAQRPQAAAPPPPPPMNLPPGLLERVQRMPAEGAPAFDPARPETDHQLQQAVQLLRGIAAAPAPQRRAGR